MQIQQIKIFGQVPSTGDVAQLQRNQKQNYMQNDNFVNEGNFVTQGGGAGDSISYSTLNNNTNTNHYSQSAGKEEYERARKIEQDKKQNETNYQIMKNRVNQLKRQEHRVQRILSLTQKKTIDIISSRTVYQQKQRLQEDLKRREEQRIQQLQTENNMKKTQLKQSLSMTKIRQVQKVRSDVDLMKSLKNHLMQHKQLMEQEINLRNAQSYSLVKIQERETILIKKRHEEYKKELALMDQKRKLKTQQIQSEQFKNECQKLEEVEKHLLNKIEQSKNMQKQAYQQMEKVILMPIANNFVPDGKPNLNRINLIDIKLNQNYRSNSAIRSQSSQYQ